MIRREQQNAAGEPFWLLISQCDHARLAGELAAAWSWQGLLADIDVDEFLAAIAHHDDGWSVWDSAPQISSQTGRPLSFNEMPIEESIAIWAASIGVANQLGSLATYMVTGHFYALALRHDAWRTASERERQAGEGFLALAGAQMATAAATIEATGAAGRNTHSKNVCLAWLQFFDALSLWFCIAEQLQSRTFTTPNLPSLTFTPIDVNQVIVTPWPLVASSLELGVEARQMPATLLDPNKPLDLAAAGEPQRLGWRLVPSSTVP